MTHLSAHLYCFFLFKYLSDIYISLKEKIVYPSHTPSTQILEKVNLCRARTEIPNFCIISVHQSPMGGHQLLSTRNRTPQISNRLLFNDSNPAMETSNRQIRDIELQKLYKFFFNEIITFEMFQLHCRARFHYYSNIYCFWF